MARAYLDLRNWEQARTEARLLRERWPKDDLADEAQLLTAQAWALEKTDDEAQRRLPGAGGAGARGRTWRRGRWRAQAHIHAQAGALDRALELYALALPAHPNPDAIRTNIEAVRERREKAKTAKPGDRAAAFDQNKVEAEPPGGTVKTELSEKLFAKAKDLFPGGVNSPVRAFKGVGGTPRFIARARGAHIFDVDGNDYVDYVVSWGPLILGHCHPEVMREVQDAHEGRLVLRRPLAPRDPARRARPRADALGPEDALRAPPGTEATTAAIRVARGFTGRDDILKFDGCYHGAGDALLVKAGSGVETLGLPDSPGVPADLAKHTLTLPFNDLAAVEKLLRRRRGRTSRRSSSSRWSATWACSSRSRATCRGSSPPAASTARSSSSTR